MMGANEVAGHRANGPRPADHPLTKGIDMPDRTYGPRWVELYLQQDTYDPAAELADVDYEAQYGDAVGRLIRDEFKAWTDVRALLDRAAALAVEWGMDITGDGHGGALISDWVLAIERHLGRQLLPEPASKPKGRSPISARKRVRIFARDGYRCVECGERDPEQLSLDHIVAVSKGGGDEDENLRTLCMPCNLRKGTRDL